MAQCRVMFGEFELGTITEEATLYRIRTPGHAVFQEITRLSYHEAVEFFRMSLPPLVRRMYLKIIAKEAPPYA